MGEMLVLWSRAMVRWSKGRWMDDEGIGDICRRLDDLIC